MTVTPPAQSTPPLRRLRVSRLGMLANGVGLVALLTAAWFVAESTPSDAVWQGAIPVHGEVGETITGRNLEATITDVRMADEVVASNGWAGPTAGVWVIVDASVARVVNDIGTGLGTADLVIDSTTFSASERPDLGTIAGQHLTTGIPLTGPLMFEVPRELVSTAQPRTVQIQLATNSDTRTDSLLVIDVDLSELTIESTIETDEPTRGMR